MINLYVKAISGAESSATRQLLLEVLERDHGIVEPEICLGAQGKPYIVGGPAISISHSHGYGLVAVGEEPLGVDMEVVRPYSEKLPERIFSPVELKWFQEGLSTKVRFFTLWTLKEAYYKYLGTGLPGIPRDTSFERINGRWRNGDSDCCFSVLEEKNLLIAVCSNKQIEISLRWE